MSGRNHGRRTRARRSDEAADASAPPNLAPDDVVQLRARRRGGARVGTLLRAGWLSDDEADGDAPPLAATHCEVAWSDAASGHAVLPAARLRAVDRVHDAGEAVQRAAAPRGQVRALFLCLSFYRCV